MSKLAENLKKAYGDVKRTVEDADNIRKGCNTGRSPDEREAALKRVKQFPDEEEEEIEH